MRSTVNQPTAPGLNLRLDPIDVFVTDGFLQRCRQVFCPNVVWLTSTNKMDVVQRAFGNPAAGDQDRTVGYPYMLASLQSVTLAQDRMNTLYGATRGLQTVLQTDGNNTYNVNFLPVDMSVSLEFVSDSMRAVMDYAARWMFANRNNLLAFEVNYGRTTFTVVTLFDEALQIPQRDATRGSLPEYVVTGTCTIKGFVSESVLIQAQVANKIVESTTFATALGEPATSDNTTTWAFQKAST